MLATLRLNLGEPLADIFISYARADRDRIENLAAALEADGHTLWWDRHIDAGAEFSADIERELDAARAVIVCWSKEGSASRWVKDEANIAAEAGKLIAITLDEELPPIGFRQYHAVDFSGWADGADAAPFPELARALNTKLGAENPTLKNTAADNDASGAALNEAPPEPRDPLAVFAKNPAIAIALAAAVLITAITFTFLPRGGDKTSPNIVTAENADPRETAAPDKSIAVLPFANRSPDPNDAFFTEGVHDDLLTQLSKITDMRVISRTSVMGYTGADRKIPEIAKELGVATIMEGAVQARGQSRQDQCAVD